MRTIKELRTDIKDSERDLEGIEKHVEKEVASIRTDQKRRAENRYASVRSGMLSYYLEERFWKLVEIEEAFARIYYIEHKRWKWAPINEDGSYSLNDAQEERLSSEIQKLKEEYAKKGIIKSSGSFERITLKPYEDGKYIFNPDYFIGVRGEIALVARWFEELVGRGEIPKEREGYTITPLGYYVSDMAYSSKKDAEQEISTDVQAWNAEEEEERRQQYEREQASKAREAEIAAMPQKEGYVRDTLNGRYISAEASKGSHRRTAIGSDNKLQGVVGEEEFQQLKDEGHLNEKDLEAAADDIWDDNDD